MHKTLTNWTAKRAGGRITIYGTNEAGNPDRIVGVDKIAPDPAGECMTAVLATDKDGEVHILKLTADPARNAAANAA
jgi:hypothetical protein